MLYGYWVSIFKNEIKKYWTLKFLKISIINKKNVDKETGEKENQKRNKKHLYMLKSQNKIQEATPPTDPPPKRGLNTNI